MKYPIVEQLTRDFPVTVICETLDVSNSGYYAWKERPDCSRRREDLRIRAHIRAIFKKSKKTYGSPRIHRELREQDGIRCGRKRVLRLMRQDELKPKQVKKFRATTDSKHKHPVAPNLLDRQFEVETPNTVWLGDLTYIWTEEGWLYLAALMDLACRRIVGWSMGERITQELAQKALKAAFQNRRPKPGLLHHTDRGSQYAAKAYQERLESYGMTCSMSRRGNCWDNAPMESFFHSLKVERVNHRRYKTRAEAKADVFQYIEGFYNSRRLHSALDYQSPAQYEATYFREESAENLRKSCGKLTENLPSDLSAPLLPEKQPPPPEATTVLV